MATAQSYSRVMVTGDCGILQGPAEESRDIWRRVSTWGLLLLLLYFALDGVSPFDNSPVATRTVAVSSGVLVERLGKISLFTVCLFLALLRRQSICRLSMQTKLVAGFPILALLLSPVSQLPTRTISSAILLLGAVLLVYYIMSRYSFDEVLGLLLVLGFATMAASIVFALVLPQYGRDLLGGHSSAWKGIFSAKNYLGNVALFLLTVAVSYRSHRRLLQLVRMAQIVFCLTAIVFSQAATAYLLTAIYLTYLATIKTLHGFRKKDYFVLFVLLFAAFSAAAVAIVVWPDSLVALLGKDLTFTGRTEIWSAVIDSIAKRPLLGYGYQAFWLGLTGESYRVILVVTWELAQAQNGFLDVTLEMGVAGLAIVLLVFGFAFRDALTCLFRSRDDAQLRAVEWYLAIIILTLLCNLGESFLFDPLHLGSLMFLLACVGLKMEWMSLRASPAHQQ